MSQYHIKSSIFEIANNQTIYTNHQDDCENNNKWVSISFKNINNAQTEYYNININWTMHEFITTIKTQLAEDMQILYDQINIFYINNEDEQQALEANETTFNDLYIINDKYKFLALYVVDVNN